MHAMMNGRPPACGTTQKKVRFSRFRTVQTAAEPGCNEHNAIYTEIDYCLKKTMNSLKVDCANAGKPFPPIPLGTDGNKPVGAAIVTRLTNLLTTECAYPFTSYDFEGHLKTQEVDCPIDEYVVSLLKVAIPGLQVRCKDVCRNPLSPECIQIQSIIGKYVPTEFARVYKHILYLFDMHMAFTFQHSFFGIDYQFAPVQGGASTTTTYKNKTYKIQQGARGGRFIRVKTAQGTFKKVYM